MTARAPSGRWAFAFLVQAALVTVSDAAAAQSALAAQGQPADALRWLIWVLIAVGAVIWAMVTAVLMMALWRARRTGGARSRGGPTLAVGAAVGGTVVTIAALTVVSFLISRQQGQRSAEDLIVRVRGYQWWWEVSYLGDNGGHAFVTANEIHVPVGRPVRLVLGGGDVIHSFWVPSLAGKQDLLPGRTTELVFTAERPGVYRGQCAEFCGLQHAHMAVLVVAEDAADFAAWQRGQLASAPAPGTEQQAAGRKVFEEKGCAGCHTVRGTTASGARGPDLTHVASRRSIAAGLFEPTQGAFAAWIADPQTAKPGNNMPMVALGAEELKAVAAYMTSLQ